MPQFQPSTPFPAIDPASIATSEIFAHAAACDRWLDLRVDETERVLSEQGCRARAPRASGEKQLIWIGLEPQLLQTPYSEIRWWLERLGPGANQTVVDLGAAYGRMGFVLARHFPQTNFIGYEYVGERVREGRRALAAFGASRASLEHVDLSAPDFAPASADLYFLYDFGSPKAIEKTLHDLRRISQQRPVTIVSRGRHCRYIIDCQHAWLRNAFPHEGETRITVYRSEAWSAIEDASLDSSASNLRCKTA